VLPSPYEDFKNWDDKNGKNIIEQFSEQYLVQSDNNSYSRKDLSFQQGQQNKLNKRIYTPHGHSYLEKKKKISEHNDDLKEIIGIDSDQD
jgi:hypothetical protein